LRNRRAKPATPDALAGEPNVMQIGGRQMLLRAVAVATAGSGLWFIISRWFEYQNAPLLLSETAHIAGLWFAVISGIMMLVAVLKVVVAIGLWQIRRCAWYAALVILSVDFLILGFSAVRFLLAASNVPSVNETSASGATIVEVHSVWPTYTVAGLSLLSLVALVQGVVRKKFEV